MYNQGMTIYYTDGSASPNPGPGGFAVIRDLQPWILGSEDGETTNIRMEGKALIAALQDADEAPCVIYTDSEFWINVVTKWAPGWRNSAGCAVMRVTRAMSWRMSGPTGRG